MRHHVHEAIGSPRRGWPVMKYLAFARSEFLRGFRYRANLWATLASTMAIAVIQWSLWHAVYGTKSHIAGLSLNAVLSYSLMGRVTSGFLDSPSNLNIGGRVRQGTIVHDLVKPVDFHTQLLFQSLGRASFRLVSTGVPILIALWWAKVLKAPSASVAILFVISLSLSYVTLFSTAFLSGILTFYTKTGVGLDEVYTVVALLSGEFVPLEFFPGWLQALANVLPFKAIYYIPMAMWSGIADPSSVGTSFVSQLAWTAGMVILSKIAWSGAVKHLTIQGG